MCVTYCMPPFSCFDVSRMSMGCQNMMSLTDIDTTSKLDICQTKLTTSQYVYRTSEIDVRKWHIPDWSSEVHRTSLDVNVRNCINLHWHPQNLNVTSGSNTSKWNPQDIHWNSRIDVSYWPTVDKSPDVHRASLGLQDSTTDSDLSWTKSLTSPLCLDDVSIWHILDNGAITRLLLGCQFWPDQNGTLPYIQERKVFAGIMANQYITQSGLDVPQFWTRTGIFMAFPNTHKVHMSLCNKRLYLRVKGPFTRWPDIEGLYPQIVEIKKTAGMRGDCPLLPKIQITILQTATNITSFTCKIHFCDIRKVIQLRIALSG